MPPTQQLVIRIANTQEKQNIPNPILGFQLGLLVHKTRSHQVTLHYRILLGPLQLRGVQCLLVNIAIGKLLPPAQELEGFIGKCEN